MQQVDQFLSIALDDLFLKIAPLCTGKISSSSPIFQKIDHFSVVSNALSENIFLPKVCYFEFLGIGDMILY